MKYLENSECSNFITDTFSQFKKYLFELLSSSSEKIKRRATLIISWLSQWLKFLKYENKFNPITLKRYLRGEIIKVQFGFNVDKELGGVHYAIVLDKYDSNYKHTITVVPLSSLKDRDKNKLGNRLYLGDEPKTSINKKYESNLIKLKTKLDKYSSELKQLSHSTKSMDEKIKHFQKLLDHNIAISKELSYMHNETIALTDQIKTISKMRIVNPKTSEDALSNIKIPKKVMQKILNKIKKLYF